MKRKRCPEQPKPRKRLKPAVSEDVSTRQSRVLSACYPVILSLRAYLRARLPAKSSRRKLLNTPQGPGIDAILDGWTVGVLEDPTPEVKRARSKEFVAFTQTQSRTGLSQTACAQTCALEDVIDFVVWQLFNPSNERLNRPSHVLCNGLQRGLHHEGSPVAPGIVRVHPNDNLTKLRSSHWQQIFSALGADGEPILTSLLLDCGLFSQLENGEDNLYQVSGKPIHELKTKIKDVDSKTPKLPKTSRKPSDVTFVRNRILYAKPSLNGRGMIRFGLKHIHVLQRFSDPQDQIQTIHFLKHVFPRQFELHNVFTSEVDKKLTSHPFYDYVYREDEIGAKTDRPKSWLPRRLRGRTLKLAQDIRRGHTKCSYVQLLRHYCGLGQKIVSSKQDAGTGLLQSQGHQSGSTKLDSQIKVSPKSLSSLKTSAPSYSHERSLLVYATPTAKVAAFCRAVFRAILPRRTFGIGEDGRRNWDVILQQVDAFVRLRRFESTTLHHVCQNIRMNSIEWLVPDSISVAQKPSRQDRDKRLQLLWEFVYYLFDSLLIPLLQTNFYVTETGTQRNRLFYFRQDVWRKLAEPSLHSLRVSTYQQLQPAEVKRLLNSRSLGYSYVRLLPKNEGTRTITNLRRRMVATSKGRRVLGPSINTQLVPILGALSSEAKSSSTRLGGAILSTGGLHERLKHFRNLVSPGSKLYFAKVDVQSCFDSIPQESLLDMIRDVFASNAYRTTRYIETKPSGNLKTRQRYLNLARPADGEAAFSKDTAEQLCALKVGRVFSEVGYQKVWSKQQLLDLLQQHVRNNVVKIGKKHYRQTEGIPQGSVLSSLLCSFFYTAFEHDQLGFLDRSNTLLVRLIDDFLLITTDLSSARKFLRAMTAPQAQYGIIVNPDKTLANFEAAIGAHKVPRHMGKSFPYCGITIDTVDLQIGKDRQKKDYLISNGLTVDLTKNAGAVLERKVRLSLVQQMLKMLLDKDMNSPSRRLLIMMEAFHETAMKMFRYIHDMRSTQYPSARTAIRIFDNLGRVAVKYGQSTTCGHSDSTGQLSRSQILWALSDAFERVFSRKQSQFRALLGHVENLKTRNRVALGISSKEQQALVTRRDAAFVDYVY